jgi:hypothetical protein
MEKQIKKQTPKQQTQFKWGAEEAIQDLLDHGAIEIPKEDLDKEPYKTYMKNIKKDGKFICD